MDMDQYPILVAENPNFLSLAHYPLELVLYILESILSVPQIIHVDVSAAAFQHQFGWFLHNDVTRNTTLTLREPPLNGLSRVCRLFRHMYIRSRPNFWGYHLYKTPRSVPRPRPAYHVNLATDLFYVRQHSIVQQAEWNRQGRPTHDALANGLLGIKRMGTAINHVVGEDVVAAGVRWLLHLNPDCDEISVVVPAAGVEDDRGELELVPVFRPLGADLVLAIIGPAGILTGLNWGKCRNVLIAYLNERFSTFQPPAQDWGYWERTWRLCESPRMTGCLVDQRRVNDPRASGLRWA